jgi:hypothetical protein
MTAAPLSSPAPAVLETEGEEALALLNEFDEEADAELAQAIALSLDLGRAADEQRAGDDDEDCDSSGSWSLVEVPCTPGAALPPATGSGVAVRCFECGGTDGLRYDTRCRLCDARHALPTELFVTDAERRVRRRSGLQHLHAQLTLATRGERIWSRHLRDAWSTLLWDGAEVAGYTVLPACTWCGTPTGGWCDLCQGGPEEPARAVCSECGGTDGLRYDTRCRLCDARHALPTGRPRC